MNPQKMMAAGLPAGTAKAVAGEVTTGITAAGTVLGDATGLTNDINVIATAAAATGVRLPTPNTVGQRVAVYNGGANTVNIFPSTSAGTINGGAGGAAVTLATAKSTTLIATGANAWHEWKSA